MMKNIFRTIAKNKTFSIVNILGLTISLAGFILMILYLENEWSYDRFHDNADRIYRLVDAKQTPEATFKVASSAAPVAPALLTDFPEIEAAVRILPTEMLMLKEDIIFQERSVLFADDRFFDVFDFHLIEGDASSALSRLNSVVLTASTAKKYFGSKSPLGENIIADDQLLTVTGVTKDVPDNAHFSFDFLISMENAKQKNSGYDWLFNNWYSDQFYTYLLLPENYEAQQLEDKLVAFDKRHREVGDNTVHTYTLEALTDIYLHSALDNQIGKTGNATNASILFVVALFVLFLASINYINLSTAQATRRALEVGIRKTIGADRGQLFLQFISESFFITGIGLALAIVVVLLALPFFNSFLGINLGSNLFSITHLCAVIILYVAMSFLAGIYPSSILANYKTAKVLKSKTAETLRNFGIRKALVVLQFSISIFLIIASLVVYHQLNFMQNAALGFEPKQTLVIDFGGDEQIQKNRGAIQQQLLSIPGVKSISASSGVPGKGKPSGWSMRFLSLRGDTLKTEVPLYIVDYNFLDQYNIDLLAGRAFSERYDVDSEETILISETTVKSLGFDTPEEILGTKVQMYPKTAEVIGVFQDFHYESLQQHIQPLAMRIFPFGLKLFSLQLETNNIQSTLAAIEKKWKIIAPQRPLDYTFLDEDYNKQYQSEAKFSQTLGLFTLFALFIASLGLLGLTLFSVQQRTKEIGTRKILGASTISIMRLLTQDFLKLVIVAIFIAIPLAWYFMQKWLQNFAFNDGIQLWIFAVAGALAIVIAFLTVSFQSVSAALANPVESLRNE